MMPELLAPAGNAEMLHAAVSAGADAVYLGMGDFNARRNADNFDASSFGEACEYAHLRGVRVYVTLNTIILPSEVKSALECAKACDRLGADGFIVADIGLACAIRTAIPDACIHISTQMSIHSVDGLMACAAMGAMRVTLARELAIAEIRAICEMASSLGIEVEAFVHGAICFCYSGQCLMSSMIGGRSANRGLCAQPCRMQYELVDEEGNDVSVVSGSHLLSPKDLCGIDVLPELVDCGVSSLKVEGRMKSAEYVYTTVSVYRQELDRLCKPKGGIGADPDRGCHATDDAKQRLESVFSRGFTSGYLEGDRSNAIMGYGRPNNRGQFVGRLREASPDRMIVESDSDIAKGDILQVWTKKGNVSINVNDVEESGMGQLAIRYSLASNIAQGKAAMRPGDRAFRVHSKEAEFDDEANEPSIPVTCYVEMMIGKPLKVRFEVARDPEGDGMGPMIAKRLKSECSEPSASLSASFVGDAIEPARTKPISVQDVEEHIGRMGGSGFELVSIEVMLDENVGIGFSQLHKARKAALDSLRASILDAYQRPRNSISVVPQWLAAYQSIARSADASERGKRSGHRPRNAARRLGTQIDNTIYAMATNPDCARVARRNGASEIYVPAYDYKRGASSMLGCAEDATRQAGYPKGCIMSMPTISHDRLDAESYDGDDGRSQGASSHDAHGRYVPDDPWELARPGAPVLVGSVGSLFHSEAIDAIPHIAPTLSIANAESANAVTGAGAKVIWLSPELELSQIKRIADEYAGDARLGIVVNGYQELMVSEHCILMSMGECSQRCDACPRRRTRHFLKDRKGYLFPVYTDASGKSHVMNSIEYDVTHSILELIEAGVTAFMVDSTMMTPEECAQRVGNLSKALDLASEGKSLAKESGKTTGHLYRGVM